MKIKYFVFTAVAMLTFASCTDYPDYQEATIPANSAQVYFDNRVTELDIAAGQTGVTIPVMRGATTDAFTATITSADESGMFTIPATVTFNAGEDTANLTVTFDPSQLVLDQPYPITLTIDDTANTTPWGLSTTTINILYPSTWTSLGMVDYTDVFINTAYGTNSGSAYTYQVEIQANDQKPGVYRLINPYGAVYPDNAPGDWDTSQDWNITINATDPTAVYMDYPQDTGVDWGDGEIFVGGVAGQNIANGSTIEAEKEAGNCGTLVNGVITFPAGTLMVGLPDVDYTEAYEGGDVTIVLPSE